MDVNRNKDVLRRFYDELWTEGNVDVIPELIADDYIDHQSPPGLTAGPHGLADLIRSWKRGFPDGTEEPDAMIGEDDLVVGRFTFRGTHLGEFMGVAPTGRSVVMTGIDVVRIRNGKITEFWYSEQLHDLLHQLDALPPQIAGRAT